MAVEKEKNQIDVAVGKRVRMKRNLLEMSQEALAEKLGVTFQQVQKYERAANRISASKLYEISLALNVPISFFFEDVVVKADSVSGMAEPESGAFLADFYATPESSKLNVAFQRIRNPTLRRQVAELAKTIADETGESEEQQGS